MLRSSPLVLLLLTSQPLRAEVITLQDVERKALAGGATKAAQARVVQAEAESDAARSGQRPVVNLRTEAAAAPGGQLIEVETVDGERFLVQGARPLGQPGAFTTLPRYGAVVSLQANVYDFGRTASRIRAAEHRAVAMRVDEKAAAANLLQSAREAYLRWVVAQAQLALAERHERDARSGLETVKGLVAEGSRAPSELSAAEQHEVGIGIELADARAAVSRARRALEHLVGEAWPGSAVPDLGLLEIATAPAPNREPPLGAVALEQQAAASTAMAESAAHDHAPVITAAAEAGIRGQSTSLFPAGRVGVTVTVPLWDGGLGAAQARAARAQADALRADASAARKAREDEEELARADMGRAEEKLGLARRLCQLAQKELEQANERYQLGAFDLRAVLEVRERLTRAEGQELTAKAERASAWLRAQP